MRIVHDLAKPLGTLQRKPRKSLLSRRIFYHCNLFRSWQATFDACSHKGATNLKMCWRDYNCSDERTRGAGKTLYAYTRMHIKDNQMICKKNIPFLY